MKLICFSILVLASALALSCVTQPEEESETATVDNALNAVPAGAPGGGQFCCVHPGGGFWHTGEVDPVTHLVMTTQAQVNGACTQGHLPTRYAC